MKKIINLIVCISTILALSSCNSSKEQNNHQNTQENATTIEGFSQELKNKIAAHDTLMKELVCKVDTLAHALTQIEKENARLKEKLESPKSTWYYIPMVALLLLIIAFIVFHWKLKGSKEKKTYESVKRRLDDSFRRIEKLEKHVVSAQYNSRTLTSNANVQNVEFRLRQLEQRLEQVIKDIDEKANTAQRPTPSCSKNPDVPRESEYHMVGYAKNDADVYFTKIYESNQEGCVFKIIFTSPKKGKFNIISLDKIQSRNDWQQKVECSGISIKEASGFSVEDEGICEEIDDNTWKVTKPLKIKLLK